MFDATTLRRLRALDIVPLRQRRPAAAAGDSAVMTDAPASGVPHKPVLHLWFAPEVPDPLPAPSARLLDDVLCSLDLDASQIVRMAGERDPGGEHPVLAFGTGAPDGAVRLPTLEKLRNPLEKRIAWPILRGLRRRLRRGAP